MFTFSCPFGKDGIIYVHFFPTWMQSSGVRRTAVQSQGVYFLLGGEAQRVMVSCFSMLGEFMCVPQVCHSYNIAVLTQQPFTELTAVPSLKWVWEIFLSCDKKACSWFAGQNLGTVAMALCCEDKNNATLSSPAKTPNSIEGVKCQASLLGRYGPAPLTGFSGRKQQRKGFQRAFCFQQIAFWSYKIET